jgi:hypothetical protein
MATTATLPASAGARIRRLEGVLTPLEAVLLWLAEAQAFGSLAAYLAWLTEQPAAAWPLVRITRQVRSAVESERRGPPATVAREGQRAVGDAIFRFALALELECWTAQTQRTWQRDAALLGLLAAALGAPRDEGEGGDRPAPIRREFGDRLAEHAMEVLAAAEVRRLLARHYLAGHAALFPDTALAARRAVDEAERLAERGRGTRSGRQLRWGALTAAARGQAGAVADVHLAAAHVIAAAFLGDEEQAAHLLTAPVRAPTRERLPSRVRRLGREGATPSAALASAPTSPARRACSRRARRS